MADPVAPAAPVVKSGWKTTEMWLVMFLLGIGAWLANQLVAALPAILATPGVPGWVGAIAPIAGVGLAWVAKRLVVQYNDSRTQLKLAAIDPVAAANAAGEAAANAVQTPSDAGAALAKP